jgi:hypothetical protein
MDLFARKRLAVAAQHQLAPLAGFVDVLDFVDLQTGSRA